MYLIWGVLIGLVMAAPIGPVNIICIRRALTKGPMNGFTVGTGAAIADGIFGAFAAFGLAGLTAFIEEFNIWFQVVGGSALIIIAVKLWFSHPHVDDVKDTYKDRIKAAVGTFLLTFSNPLTVLGFVAIFIGMGLGEMGNDLVNATLISTGILLGSLSWWFIVSFGAAKLGKGLSDQGLETVNHVSAVIIFLFGIAAVAKNLSAVL
ncbi:LysE family translocator [Pseudemcibacter aquimaris]|uniref:LysE family translocator n=1 Tax=Pseudemcibacter aquimaris TaxID=2857064 RepID=UPI0020138A76|nr:LysE family transporter [Pseudemcibacter aquimaris]MCC3862205.1 LysE family translocator [Pseudemcibacter aquimaris]WDU58958.1 LysE family translocator [Pseudemcibacter aquimaris]